MGKIQCNLAITNTLYNETLVIANKTIYPEFTSIGFYVKSIRYSESLYYENLNAANNFKCPTFN